MLKGKIVNLKAARKDDVSLVAEWWSNSQYMGEYQDVVAISEAKLEKVVLEDTTFFVIEKKGGTKIGHINGFMRKGTMRKSWCVKGDYIDMYLYSILREEWKEPKPDDSSFG